jgi:hypothetical protein
MQVTHGSAVRNGRGKSVLAAPRLMPSIDTDILRTSFSWSLTLAAALASAERLSHGWATLYRAAQAAAPRAEVLDAPRARRVARPTIAPPSPG